MLFTSRVRVRIEKSWDRSDAHLIVVGTYQRYGLGRIGHLSVSRGVLPYAPMSVAWVPLSAAAEQTRPLAEPCPEFFDDGIRLAARGALIVPVFHQFRGGCGRSLDVIAIPDWRGQYSGEVLSCFMRLLPRGRAGR